MTKNKDEKLKVGVLYEIEYQDASYTFFDIEKENILPPSPIISIGKLRGINQNFIDIGLKWSADDNKFFEGIVIPIKSIVSFKKLN
ncbi:MAG: hypothetical protein AAB726_01625 [Patescibacteria group bacterium]